MPLYRDASNGRVYLIEAQFAKWLTNDQFNDLQQPYVTISNLAVGRVCGAYGVPINQLPTVSGGEWSYARQVSQDQTAINLTHKNEIIAKINETHQG